jgi:hypothetical protein
MAERMAKQKKPSISFFFFRGNPDRNTAFKLWPTLAFQIARWDEQLKTQIGKAIARTPDIFTKTLASQLESLIVEPLMLTLSELQPRWPSARWFWSRVLSWS